jgi:hypothetical protein
MKVSTQDAWDVDRAKGGWVPRCVNWDRGKLKLIPEEGDQRRSPPSAAITITVTVHLVR